VSALSVAMPPPVMGIHSGSQQWCRAAGTDSGSEGGLAHGSRDEGAALVRIFAVVVGLGKVIEGHVATKPALVVDIVQDVVDLPADESEHPRVIAAEFHIAVAAPTKAIQRSAGRVLIANIASPIMVASSPGVTDLQHRPPGIGRGKVGLPFNPERCELNSDLE
jgi:hypothetical protein